MNILQSLSRGSLGRRANKSTALTQSLLFGCTLAFSMIVWGDTRSLDAGVEVKLELTQGIGSKTNKTGDAVYLQVAEDVKDASGNVLIAKGTPALGQVTWARPAKFRNIFLNRPVRLEVGFPATVATDGQNVPMCFEYGEVSSKFRTQLRPAPLPPDVASRTNFLLNSDNPGIKYLRDAANDPTKSALANDTFQALARRDTATLDRPDVRAFLAGAAESFGLPNSAQLFNEKNAKLLKKLVDIAQKTPEVSTAGGSSRLTPTEAIAIGIVLATAFKEIYDRLGQWIDSRNILVAVGTPLQTYVWLQPPQKSLPINSTEYNLASEAAAFNMSSSTWSYGYFKPATTPGTTEFVAFDRKKEDGASYTWSTLLTPVPSMMINRGETTLALPASTITVAPHQLILQPSNSAEPGAFAYSVVRWTSPVDGTFDVDATFSGADTATSSDVYVLAPGATPFHTDISGSGPASVKPSHQQLHLNKGQTVDFVVGPGNNKDATGDATSIDVKIKRVFQ